MATMPSRIVSLKTAVESILPQCDEMHISLNGDWDSVEMPPFLKHKKIKLYKTADYWPVDPGGTSKFYKAFKQVGYIITIDDDFIYPADYIKTLVAGIEKYNRKAVCSFHGRKFPDDRKIHSYYRDRQDFYISNKKVPEDVFVHTLGSGVMGFHSSTLPPIERFTDVFPRRNMIDILMGAFLNKHAVPRVVLAHEENWLISVHTAGQKSISGTFTQNDAIQTETVNSITWLIHTC